MVLKPLLLQNSVVKPLSHKTWKIFEIPIRLENNERKIHLVECPPLLPIVIIIIIIIIIVIFTYFDRSQQWHFLSEHVVCRTSYRLDSSLDGAFEVVNINSHKPQL